MFAADVEEVERPASRTGRFHLSSSERRQSPLINVDQSSTWFLFYSQCLLSSVGNSRKDRSVKYNDQVVGMIKTLVFHRGKAPRGDRTDWVMHEYRLEEKKLADIGVVQDSYMLYVVFKKDGVGPKNGAQYGAPFKEDDWSDDDEETNLLGTVSLCGTSLVAVASGSCIPESVCVEPAVDSSGVGHTAVTDAYTVPISMDTPESAMVVVADYFPAPLETPQHALFSQDQEPNDNNIVSMLEVFTEEDDQMTGNVTYSSIEVPKVLEEDDILSMLASFVETGDLKWHFFCPTSKKYGRGDRVNRATVYGYWKATGKDRSVKYNDEVVGMIKTLVFHQGKAPRGDRTDWVMHEYRLEEKKLADRGVVQDSYMLYVVFKKDGVGPKNGAQYGAPFNEDDWIDDDEETNLPGTASLCGTSMVASRVNTLPLVCHTNNEVNCTTDADAYTVPTSMDTPEAPMVVFTDSVPALLEPPQHALVPLEEPNDNNIVSMLEVFTEEDDQMIGNVTNSSIEAPKVSEEDDILSMLASFVEVDNSNNWCL
ncbi:hypothetical protein GQ457_06G034690 [Hibiscus cannabinus]